MAKNPLFYNKFWKTERHNSTAPICRIYEKQVEQMINIKGVTMFYFPISEYDLEGVSKLWGEDPNKKYLEKYTLKGLTEGENDSFVFNSFGVDKTSAERTVFISKKAFREITGREDPLEGDMFQWTQNNIIYEVTEVSDQDHIVLGQEMSWKLIAIPRMTEGEVFGLDDCNSTRDQVIDPGDDGNAVTECTKTDAPQDDGNVIEDPDNVHIPGPTEHILDDEQIIDTEKASIVTRNSWGGW